MMTDYAKTEEQQPRVWENSRCWDYFMQTYSVVKIALSERLEKKREKKVQKIKQKTHWLSWNTNSKADAGSSIE